MKKLFGKSFLALVLAMTMLMGMSMTAMAASDDLPADAPECTCTKHLKHLYVYGVHTDGSYDILEYEGSQAVNRGMGFKEGNWEVRKWYDYLSLNECSNNTPATPATPAAPSHTHSYEWSVLSDPTTETDGVEAYICSCGDIQATQPISAAHHILKLNADAVKNAKAGATVVVELGRLNSLPRWFVTKLVERDDLNVTLKITYNHQNYTLDIPKTATIEDESIEWYGPLKLLSMFPQK